MTKEERERREAILRSLVTRISIEHEVSLDQAEIMVFGAMTVKLLAKQSMMLSGGEMGMLTYLSGIMISQTIEQILHNALVKISGLSENKFKSMRRDTLAEIDRALS